MACNRAVSTETLSRSKDVAISSSGGRDHSPVPKSNRRGNQYHQVAFQSRADVEDPSLLKEKDYPRFSSKKILFPPVDMESEELMKRVRVSSGLVIEGWFYAMGMYLLSESSCFFRYPHMFVIGGFWISSVLWLQPASQALRYLSLLLSGSELWEMRQDEWLSICGAILAYIGCYNFNSITQTQVAITIAFLLGKTVGGLLIGSVSTWFIIRAGVALFFLVSCIIDLGPLSRGSLYLGDYHLSFWEQQEFAGTAYLVLVVLMFGIARFRSEIWSVSCSQGWDGLSFESFPTRDPLTRCPRKTRFVIWSASFLFCVFVMTELRYSAYNNFWVYSAYRVAAYGICGALFVGFVASVVTVSTATNADGKIACIISGLLVESEPLLYSLSVRLFMVAFLDFSDWKFRIADFFGVNRLIQDMPHQVNMNQGYSWDRTAKTAVLLEFLFPSITLWMWPRILSVLGFQSFSSGFSNPRVDQGRLREIAAYGHRCLHLLGGLALFVSIVVRFLFHPVSAPLPIQQRDFSYTWNQTYMSPVLLDLNLGNDYSKTPFVVVSNNGNKKAVEWLYDHQDDLPEGMLTVVYDRHSPKPCHLVNHYCAPNTGTEALPMALYVSQHYDQLPEWTLFIHGHRVGRDHQPFDMLYALKTAREWLNRDPEKKVWALMTPQEAHDGWWPFFYSVTYPYHDYVTCVFRAWEFIFPKSEPVPNHLEIVTRGQFAVHRDVLRSRSKDFWKYFAGWITFVKMPEFPLRQEFHPGYVAEYLWQSIFNVAHHQVGVLPGDMPPPPNTLSVIKI